VLACADLRGIDSHDVARLHCYFELLSAGAINPKPQIEIVRSTMSTATVDGDNGLGLVVGPRASRIAMDKAEKSGSGWVSVRNTNHFGIAGYYVLKALERDLIGWAMTNSTKLVAPL
jgi:L-2-hydroxycarboxylate dehydrogenase (NAD+)